MINAYYDGIFSDINEVKIGLFDRSVYFGDAIYEVMIGRGKKVYQLDRHLTRLYTNLNRLSIKHPKGMKDRITELISMYDGGFFYVYLQVSRRGTKRLHAPETALDPCLLITVSPLDFIPELKCAKAIFAEDKRYGFCDIKTTNILPSVLASLDAERKGCDEAIFRRRKTVTEGAKSNCFIIRNSKLFTHPKSSRILPGITRENILFAAEKLGIPYEEKAFTVEELFSADEVFITSTTKFVRRITGVDGKEVGGRDYATISELDSFIKTDFIVNMSDR